jgi:pyruvate/2-oxoglutarate dehydrogenase complex dihydrolipoamide acyltransferase (E2) component
MPQLGETVAEGKITKWFKAAGDAVKPGDNLFEIETDKTSMEVPSTTSGTLTEIRFQVGEVAKVGAVVAVISGAGEAAKLAPAGQSPLTSAKVGVQGEAALGPRFRVDERTSGYAMPPVHSTPMPRPAAPMDPFHAVRTPERNYGPAKLASGTTVTPLARRLAGERGIDLTRISGSGPHGRIVAADVERAAPGAAAPAIVTGASRAQVKALYEASPTKRCRSTRCAEPSRRGW